MIIKQSRHAKSRHVHNTAGSIHLYYCMEIYSSISTVNHKWNHQFLHVPQTLEATNFNSKFYYSQVIRFIVTPPTYYQIENEYYRYQNWPYCNTLYTWRWRWFHELCVMRVPSIYMFLCSISSRINTNCAAHHKFHCIMWQSEHIQQRTMPDIVGSITESVTLCVCTGGKTQIVTEISWSRTSSIEK